MKNKSLLSLGMGFVLSGCSISFQNISTHGYAEDLVDEMQTTSPDVKTDLDIPLTPM